MKKGLCLVLLALMLSSCGGGGEKLTFMVGGTDDELKYWDVIIKEFEAEKKIPVELIRQASDTEGRKQSLITSLRGKQKDPDVMLLDIAWIGQFAASGWLEPLNGYDIDTSVFFNSIIKLADTYKGEIIGLPLYVDGGMLYYRTDLLEKYGYKAPPKTWTELIEMSKKVMAGEKNPDFWGYVWQGAQYEGLVCNVLELFASAGGNFLNDSGKPVLDSPENLKALKMMVSFIHEASISPTNIYSDMKEEQARILFQNGNALFERNWPYAWSRHQEETSGVKGKTGIAELPRFEGKSSASTLGGWHVGISKFSDKKKDAVALLNFITSYEIQKKFFINVSWNPGRMDVYADEEINQIAPHLKTLQKIFANTIPRPSVSYYSELSMVIQKYVNSAISGSMTPEDALKNAQKEAETVVEKFKNE